MWNGCDESSSIPPFAVVIICMLFSNFFGLAVWIQEAGVVTSTLWRVFGSRTTFIAIAIGISDQSACLVSLFLMKSAASRNDVGFLKWSEGRLATSWLVFKPSLGEFQGMNIRLGGNILQIDLSMNEVRRSILTGILGTTSI